MEKLERKDLRFIALCLTVMAAGALVTMSLYYRAFPEASIEFRVNRGEARALAERSLAARGRSVSGHRFAGRFGIEEEPKVYLERELGLEKAGRFYGREAKVWRWEMRWFRSGVKEEERVEITPLGDLAAFESVRRDDAAGPSPREAEARAISQRFLTARGLAALVPIEAAPVARPHRTDWKFVDEKAGLRMAEATVRYETTVSGGEVSAFREFVHVPESWERDYKKLRSKNETANIVGNFALVVTFLAMFGVLLTKIIRHDIRWGLVGVFGLIAFLLSLLSIANGLPLALYDYDTASPLTAFVTSRLVAGLLGAIGVGALIALVVAGAEPVYRERFPQHLSLSGMFSRRGLRSKRFFTGVLLGYALTAFFFAYQVVFYVVAARLGAWAPSEVKYDDMLSTAFPWVTVLFIGFLPAVLEEGSSRMFSISFLDKLGAGRLVAVVLPAFIWGFNHAAYPNQPFYIRGLEVGLAGCAIGFLMLRFGVLPLLVWHFTVDALYTALILLRSGNTYYVVSGAAASFVLLLPLAVSLALYLARGGFEPETGLTNGDEGFVPPPAEVAPIPEEVPPVKAVRRPVFLAAGAVALLLAVNFLVPSELPAPLVEDATGRRRAEEIAKAFLKANAVSSDPFRIVTYAGNGFADDEQVRASRPDEFGRIPAFAEEDAVYVVRQGGVGAFERLTREQLPLAFWVTRFFRPLQKEEWKALVDARRGRVIGFVNPIEENAAAPPAPTEEQARRRALDAASRLGYPAASYSVIEVGTKDRPKRKDTTVTLEANPGGVGEARPRLTAVFHGSRLAAFYPSIRVPEAFRREYRRQTFFAPILVGAKVVAIGSFIGIAVVLFIRLVRTGGIGWKRLRQPLAVVGALAAAALANGGTTILRGYQTDSPLSLFVGQAVTVLSLGWLLILCVAGVGFVLLSGARPGWRRALRSKGTLGDALLRAAIAAAGLAGLDRATGLLSERVPDLFELQPTLPATLERTVPALAVFWTAAIWTFVVATMAAVAAIGAREPFFRRRSGRVLVLAALLIALVPGSFHSPVEFLGSLVPSLLTAAWLAFSAFALLRDHAAAWVFFGMLAAGGPAAAKLLAQPAPADRVAGVTAVVLLVVAALALVAGNRREPAVSEPNVAEPAPAPETV
jgi:MFS family permease